MDYWLDTLDKGACFAVYSPFDEDNTSVVDFHANSSKCVLYHIDAKELI
jgi:hypothetical protein